MKPGTLFGVILAALLVAAAVLGTIRFVHQAGVEDKAMDEKIRRLDTYGATHSTPTPAATANPETAVTRAAIRAQTPRGEIIIPQGTRLHIDSKQGDELTVSYIRWTVTIPASAVDLE